MIQNDSRLHLHWKRALFTFVFFILASASSAQTPFDSSSFASPPDNLPQPEGPGTACGFVETTWSDPDWVVATSDRILRANLCTASDPCDPTAWYDRVETAPCYPENRFFQV